MSSEIEFDYAIIGAGVGGLFAGALLARAGKSVYVAEKHYALGGYGHSFKKSKFDFCAQLHYLWNCLPGEPGHAIFQKLGLAADVPFVRLNENGFDHVYFPGRRFEIRRGFDKNETELSRLYPAEKATIRKYFGIIASINDAILTLPIDCDATHFALHPFRTFPLIRYYGYTLQELFDELKISEELQNILAGQSGNLLAPPSTVSLFIHAGMVAGYDRGACVPEKGFRHLFTEVARVILSKSGNRITTRNEALGLAFENGKMIGIRTKREGLVRAKHVILNSDPKHLPEWLPTGAVTSKFEERLKYSYSPSNFTVYLGLKDIDLMQHGFGNWNIWFYQKDSVNQVYEDQLVRNDLGAPSLFISTPTLHAPGGAQGERKGAPPGGQQMVLCTMCNYARFKELLIKDRVLYEEEKYALTQRMLDVVEDNFVPGLRKHITVCISGSPTTNERYVNSPYGNSYGADLTPANFKLGRLNSKTPLHNLHLVGAAAGVPSFAGGIHFANLLAEKLLSA